MTQAAGDPVRMRASFEAYLESWRALDIDARARLFADDVVLEDPVGAPAHAGIDAARRFWLEAQANGYAFEPQLQLFIANGWEALVRFVMPMRKADAPVLVMTIHEVLTFDADYRIKSLRAFWDQDSVVVGADQ